MTFPTLRKTVRRLILGVLGTATLVVVPAIYAATLQASGNIHTIAVDEAYRSAQLDAEGFRQVLATHGIRSIINLRGADPAAGWYEDEITTAADLGVEHFDFRMSASQALDATGSAQLIALMRAVPKPVLIHCRSGSDRTGLAAALYQTAISGTPLETAEAQLSFRYGHVGMPYFSAAYPMDEAWEVFASGLESRWKGLHGTDSSGRDGQ